MLSLFGDVKVVNGKLEKSEDGYTTEADIEANGKPIKITLSRSKSKEEHIRKQTIYEFEDGEIIDSDKIPQTSSKPGLFMRDMEEFYAAILNGKVSDENKFLTIRGLEVVEEIHSFYSKG
ncbi:uncharacterized protein LOC131956177 [Physella acuta]|uniref:uncharacterized protein LOC131956177 n=1 Tax=Physella acuta TaxID=109671 RepID=UPI0027DCD858|nr:uncharacterized protein LOC131956177 [Physella acuta]